MTVWTDRFLESIRDIVYGTVTEKQKRPYWKRILIIDDVTTTFKVGIDNSNTYTGENERI
ncbi:MAG: hypothetical protein WBE34_17715 [Candidatus Nitrosopolaris sp.]|jgi:hypothetical protein